MKVRTFVLALALFCAVGVPCAAQPQPEQEKQPAINLMDEKALFGSMLKEYKGPMQFRVSSEQRAMIDELKKGYYDLRGSCKLFEDAPQGCRLLKALRDSFTPEQEAHLAAYERAFEEIDSIHRNLECDLGWSMLDRLESYGKGRPMSIATTAMVKRNLALWRERCQRCNREIGLAYKRLEKYQWPLYSREFAVGYGCCRGGLCGDGWRSALVSAYNVMKVCPAK